MPDNNAIIARARAKATENEANYSGCAQSVLDALQTELHIGDKESFKAMTLLAGGVVRCGETCGAIIGALAALGIVAGREKIEDVATYRALIPVGLELRSAILKQIQDEFGFKEDLTSAICWDIQEEVFGRHFDLRKQEEMAAFQEARKASALGGCTRVAGIAAEVAAGKILEMKK